MSKRRLIVFLSAVFALVVSSVLCSLPGDQEEELQQQSMTNVALEGTRFARDLTGTAEALIPPTDTPEPTATNTEVPPSPTATLEPTEPSFSIVNLPPPVYSQTDPAGDAVICTDGSPVEDDAVDIQTIQIYDPALIGYDHDGWLMQIGLGAPANETFDFDWSAALLSAVAIEGSQTYTLTVNEVHSKTVTIGELDQSTGHVITDTETISFIDDLGFVWFEIPRDSAFLQVSSFHLPSMDMSFEERRCDVAPDTEVYTLDLPDE